jgi:hypothetical protein
VGETVVGRCLEAWRARSSRIQTADSPAPKMIHGAVTIRSLPVIHAA